MMMYPKMRRYCYIGSWLILLLPVLLSAAVVRQVQVEQSGIGHVDREFVLANIQTQPGALFQANLAARDVRHLLDTGRFTGVDVSVENQPGDALDVIFRLQPRMRLSAPPVIDGVVAFGQRRVRNWLDLESGSLVDDQVAGVALQRVLDEYRKRHYRAASGTWAFEVIDARQGTVRLRFTLEEGKKLAVRKITLEGNDTFSRQAMRQALFRPHPLNPWRWIFAKRYLPGELDEVAANVRRFYLDRGYLDVDVDVQTGDLRNGRYARVVVQEGPQYQIGRVAVEGVSLFPAVEVERLVASLSGTAASLLSFDQGADRLQGFYADRGYVETRVQPLMLADLERRVVDVEFQVVEGTLVRIRNIDIRGNSRTRDKVIRRELLVQPGEIYSRSRVQGSERRLRNLGFFDHVFARTLAMTEEGSRDLIFDLTEKRTGQFMMGVGFSSVDNLMGFVELSQGNFDLFGWPYFTGGGQKLRLRAQAGSTRQDYELSFVEPWFLDRKLSLGVDLYRRERSFSEYDLKRTGASISVGRSLPFASRVNLEYLLEKSVITDVSDTNTYFRLDSYDFDTGSGEPYLFESEADRLKSAVTISLTQDVRDNPFIPSRGHRINVFYSVSGGPLGGDVDMFHAGLRHSVYVPLWFGHVFSLRTRAEFVDTFGDTDEVPLAERLFAGGGRTIRGYRFRDVGSKVIRPLEGTDRFAHRPFGGLSLFVANVEYTVPVVSNVRIATFYDTGNVWNDRFEIDFQGLASSAGIGLRFDLPGFPIRIDRAWPVERDDRFTNEDAWSIWIGYDF